MQPYVVKQGDFLAKLAFELGFDADTVWNDPSNAGLRQLRPDPNVLLPTDILYIPDEVDRAPAPQMLVTGATNTFVADAPTITASLLFKDPALASQGYTVNELPQLTGLATGPDGATTFSIPVTLETFVVTFTDARQTFVFHTGQLDPIDTLSGVFQRLQSLGYIDADATLNPPDLGMLRGALMTFKASCVTNQQSQGAGADGSSTSSSNTDAPSSDPAAPSSDAPAASSDDGSADAAASAGMNDDGTLDGETSKLLQAAYGC